MAISLQSNHTQMFSLNNGSHLKAFHAVPFHAAPNSNTLIAAGGKKIKIWDLNEGKMVGIRTQGDSIASFQVLEKMMITGSKKGTIKIWSSDQEKETATFQAHTDSITSIRICDKETFISASKDKTIKIWSVLSTGSFIKKFDEGTEVNDVQVHSQSIISACADTTIKTHDILGRGEVYQLSGHSMEVKATVAKGNIIASCGLDHRLKFWNPLKNENQQCLQTIESLEKFETLHLNGNDLFSGHTHGHVKRYDFANKKCVDAIDLSQAKTQPSSKKVVCLQYDEGMLYTGSSDGIIRIFNLKA